MTPAQPGISPRHLDAAGRLAFTVQTAGTPDAAARAVAAIPLRNRDELLLAMAALVDLDQPADARHHPTIRRRNPAARTKALNAARIASLKPAWDAYQYGDRDPQVVAHANAYAEQVKH